MIVAIPERALRSSAVKADPSFPYTAPMSERSSTTPAERAADGAAHHADSGWSIETIQSLLVAFVIAMAFRSYVLEGFVIPTGSMAPTLMGAHIRLRSPQTGYEFPVDADAVAMAGMDRAGRIDPNRELSYRDPMIDPQLEVGQESVRSLAAQARFGDRVLVLKSLYPFFAPRRWDVVVFKNPTDPVGDAQNYIKRLVGLPDEDLLIVDGDIFTGPRGGTAGQMRIQRKPEHVQRAVWQPVQDLDWVPIDPARIDQMNRRPWRGVPWLAPGWTYGGEGQDRRTLEWRTGEATTITWDLTRRMITDWTAYNMFRDLPGRGFFVEPFPVSDLRVSAAVHADAPGRLSTTMLLTTRGHEFRFELGRGQASLAVTREGERDARESRSVPWRSPADGHAMEVEFWAVDQTLAIYVDGTQVVELAYDWTVAERVPLSFNGTSLEAYADAPGSARPSPPNISWSFEGSPVALRRLRVDRDLYYRQGTLAEREQFRSNGEPFPSGPYNATDPDHPCSLSPDHYLMLGDNSAASRDGRAWGRPHPLVREQIGDDTPFLVHRKLLLGKACAVYFPSPLPFSPEGRKLIPDFGRLRFIR